MVVSIVESHLVHDPMTMINSSKILVKLSGQFLIIYPSTTDQYIKGQRRLPSAFILLTWSWLGHRSQHSFPICIWTQGRFVDNARVINRCTLWIYNYISISQCYGFSDTKCMMLLNHMGVDQFLGSFGF